MSVSIKAPAAVFCLVLAIPLLGAPALSASAPKTMPASGHYDTSDFAKAQAFVGPVRQRDRSSQAMASDVTIQNAIWDA